MDSQIANQALQIAARAERELEALVAVSSPSGDLDGAETALALCRSYLPERTAFERVPCSTPGFAPDLIGRIGGTGTRRLMLLGHVDTVVPHAEHMAVRRDGDRMYGPGTVDMKGGVVLSLGVARVLAERPDAFAELAIVLVTDEEWRTVPFVHAPAFMGYDACLCFEGGERTDDGDEGVVIVRKGAGTLRVSATGRQAHSGSAPEEGANALLALAKVAIELERAHDPAGPDALTVVPTIMHSGHAINVVPAAGELFFDLRARDVGAFDDVIGAVPAAIGEVKLDATIERVWPGMDSIQRTAALLAGAGGRLGRPVMARSRGGASDASHFAATIPLTVDGLGPLGDGAHTPDEFVYASSLLPRAEVALAVAWEALGA
jgi:glutamate carboxypeptidase